MGTSTGKALMTLPIIRVGQGFDIHRFSDDPTRPLVLGGVSFPGERGLLVQAGHRRKSGFCGAPGRHRAAAHTDRKSVV